MIIHRKTLLDFISGGVESFWNEDQNGIFHLYWFAHWDEEQQTSDSPLEWLTSDVALELDRLYYLEHSGEKEISRTYERMYSNSVDWTDDAIKVKLMEMIVSKFADKWNRLYAVLTENYSPLENYDMEQVETPDITKTSATDTNITTETKDGLSKTSVYGYNSDSANPSSKVDTSGTQTVSGSSDENIVTDTESGTRTLTRHGNIGVTTSQQMLLSEVDLREKINFYNIVMNDMDSILTKLVY